jgi:NitT/TauT family transport system substrate-binding protein
MARVIGPPLIHRLSRRSVLASVAGAAVGVVMPRAARSAAGGGPVRIGMIRALYDAGIAVAYARGFFKEQGVEVELMPFGDTAESTQALGIGAIDAVVAGMSAALLNAAARGVAARIVASGGEHSPGHGVISLIMRRDLVDSGKYKGPADLKGRKIALGRYAPPHWLVKKLADQAATDVADVDVVTTGIGNVLPAMLNKAIDGASVLEPFASELIAKADAVRIATMDQVQPNFPAGYLLFGPRLSSTEPELGRRVLAAYLRGVGAYRSETSEASGRERIAETLRTLRINATADMVTLGFPDDARPSLRFVDDFMGWLTSSGVVRKPPVLAALVDDRMREQALGDIGGRL